MVKILVTITATMLFTTMYSASHMAHADIKPEDAAEYRQSVFQTMKWNIGHLVRMMKNPDEFDAAEASILGQRLHMAGGMILEGFTDDSDMVTGSNAKLEIWDDREGFQKAIDAYLVASKALSLATSNAKSPADFAQQVQNVGQSCKACHKAYRAK